MIAFPGLLVNPAKEAGIEVPPDDEVKSGEYDVEKFLRWHIFATCQLGTPMPSPSSHWDNAKVVAALPEDRLKTITPQQLCEEFGFATGFSQA